jgi:hypothetical protein
LMSFSWQILVIISTPLMNPKDFYKKTHGDRMASEPSPWADVRAMIAFMLPP